MYLVNTCLKLTNWLSGWLACWPVTQFIGDTADDDCGIQFLRPDLMTSFGKYAMDEFLPVTKYVFIYYSVSIPVAGDRVYTSSSDQTQHGVTTIVGSHSTNAS